MSSISSSDVKHPIEVESLIAGQTPSDDYYDNPEQRGRTFYTQPPRTALQCFHYYLFVRCARRATHLTTGQPLRRRISRRIIFYLILQGLAVSFIILLASLLFIFPSYARAPEHYNTLRRRVSQHPTAGIANVNNEKIFIAASIYDTDGQLAGGPWGSALERLVFLLGPSNVYLSIYEDNPDTLAVEALAHLGRDIDSNKSLVTENFDMTSLPRLTLPNNHHATKRIGFLAEVRNRALRPLDDPESPAYHTNFDKLLYLNDVIFDPVDAANLLLSTNIDDKGRTQYRAACALDFIDPFKFYDTFASRDIEGYRMGVPVFPWFTAAGNGQSRRDVLEQKDAVEVSSCWGGMVAFEAKWFQHGRTTKTPTISDSVAGEAAAATTSAQLQSNPLRFRAETELFWESSECCLIHADLHRLASLTTTADDAETQHNANNSMAASSRSTQIYMNPYIRVAYNTQTHFYLPFVRRFERLLAPFQYVLTILAHQPGFNPRRGNVAGTSVVDRVWTTTTTAQGDGIKGGRRGGVGVGEGEGEGVESLRTGRYEDVRRIAQPGGFCGGKQLLLLNIDELADNNKNHDDESGHEEGEEGDGQNEGKGEGEEEEGEGKEEAEGEGEKTNTTRAGHERITTTILNKDKNKVGSGSGSGSSSSGEIGEEVLHTGRWWSEKVPVDEGD